MSRTPQSTVAAATRASIKEIVDLSDRKPAETEDVIDEVQDEAVIDDEDNEDNEDIEDNDEDIEDDDEEGYEEDDDYFDLAQLSQLLVTEEGEPLADVLKGIREALDKHNKILFRLVGTVEKLASK